MRKIVVIGELVLDTIFSGGQPVKSFVGGRVANAAASLARAGTPCTMVSECTTDRVGDLIIDYLVGHGVNVHSVDRYPDGATRLSAIFTDGEHKQIVNYGAYPKDRFNVVWPRIDENDVVLMGSLYAVDLPQRERLMELLRHAVERKAIILYLPGLQHGIGFRITHVMPNLLENMELSQIVVATTADLAAIFPGESVEECFHHHISFYDNTFIHLDTQGVHVYNAHHHFTMPAGGNQLPVHSLGWQSGFKAGVIHGLLRTGTGREQLPALDERQWHTILGDGLRWGADCVSTGENAISAALADEVRTATNHA